jgi:hypothetical protein
MHTHFSGAPAKLESLHIVLLNRFLVRGLLPFRVSIPYTNGTGPPKHRGPEKLEASGLISQVGTQKA